MPKIFVSFPAVLVNGKSVKALLSYFGQQNAKSAVLAIMCLEENTTIVMARGVAHTSKSI